MKDTTNLDDFCSGRDFVEEACPGAGCGHLLRFQNPVEESPGVFVAEAHCPTHGKRLYRVSSPPDELMPYVCAFDEDPDEP